MNTIHVDVVSAEELIFSGEARFVALPGEAGELGVYPRHTPLITRVKPGSVRIELADGGEEFVFVAGGIIEVQPDSVTVLSDTAIRGKDLDEERANLLGYGYNSDISKLIGFMSFRFLKLSLQFPMKRINQCIKEGLSLRTLEAEFITQLEIKNEKLSEELTILSLELFPQYFDAIKVKNFMKTNFKINEGQTPINNIDCLTDQTLKRMWSKEWLLMSRY